jgi:hypothetical protein
MAGFGSRIKKKGTMGKKNPRRMPSRIEELPVNDD